jgi:uncharacterized protein YjlB
MITATKAATPVTLQFADDGTVPNNARLVVIGAYPPSGKFDLSLGGKAEHAEALALIPNVPPPTAHRRPGVRTEKTAHRAVARMSWRA